MSKKSPIRKKLPAILQEQHQGYAPNRWPAGRLEGKVENRGLKNIGRQAKKGKRGDR